MVTDSFWGTHAYLIKKTSIIKIYNLLLNMDTHIDIQISRLIKSEKIKGYFIIDPLINQESFESQIPKRLDKLK